LKTNKRKLPTGDDWYACHPKYNNWSKSKPYAAQAWAYLRDRALDPVIGEVHFKPDTGSEVWVTYKEYLPAILWGIANHLTDREKFVLQSHMGLGTPRKKLDDIGAKLKVTRERVRQIEAQGIRKILKLLNHDYGLDLDHVTAHCLGSKTWKKSYDRRVEHKINYLEE
jgi:hypothetical protein